MALITQVRGDSGYLASVLPPRGAPRLDASLRMRAESCAKKLSQVRALRKRAGRKGAPKEGERRKSNKGSGAHSASMYDADGERERERERQRGARVNTPQCGLQGSGSQDFVQGLGDPGTLTFGRQWHLPGRDSPGAGPRKTEILRTALAFAVLGCLVPAV